MAEIRIEEEMKANELTAHGTNKTIGSSKRKHYWQIALLAWLLVGGPTASLANSDNSSEASISEFGHFGQIDVSGTSHKMPPTLGQYLLAEAKPADSKDKHADDTDSDSDKDDKKAQKLKRKQEKQAQKEAEEADKAKKDKTADKGKKDDKKESRAVEKAKKDDKPADTAKTKTVVTEKTTKTDKPAAVVPAKAKVTTEASTTTVSKTKSSGDEEKKESEDNKTADSELKSEPLPTYAPDSALISVLKDLSRSLKDSEEFTKIEDPSQKAIVEIAQQALQKALEDPQLSANRIVEKVGKENKMPPMGAEAWSSGDLDLGDKNRASLSAVWAKRENGLVNVTVAGACPDKKAPNGKKIGEFIVVFNARSSVESGFDIQSQQNVSFWLGKIASITVESDCCAPPQAAAAADGQAVKPKETNSDNDTVKKKSLTVLPAILTNRRREYLAALMSVEKHNSLVATKLQEDSAAKPTEADKTDKVESAAAAQISDLPPGIEAKTMQEAYERALRAVAMKELMKMSPGADADKASDKDKNSAAATKEIAADGKTSSKDAAAKTDAAGQTAIATAAVDTKITQTAVVNNKTSEPAKAESAAANAGGQPALTSPPVQATQPVQPATLVQPAQPTASVQAVQPPQTVRTAPPATIAVLPSSGGAMFNNAGPDNVAAFRAVRQPSLGALMMVPERALAGQSMTISIFDDKRNPESSIELSLNGSTMITNIDGQVSFTIPEDATPGKSLNVALAARPEMAPTVIDILQPLNVPSEKQNPNIEKVSLTGTHNDTLIIEGHFFDGIATNNKITIDGQQQGRIAAASPVELRVSLPFNLQGGDHVVAVGCDGLNSNPGVFATQAPPVAAAPPADRKKSKPPHY